MTHFTDIIGHPGRTEVISDFVLHVESRHSEPIEWHKRVGFGPPSKYWAGEWLSGNAQRI